MEPQISVDLEQHVIVKKEEGLVLNDKSQPPQTVERKFSENINICEVCKTQIENNKFNCYLCNKNICFNCENDKFKIKAFKFYLVFLFCSNKLVEWQGCGHAPDPRDILPLILFCYYFTIDFIVFTSVRLTLMILGGIFLFLVYIPIYYLIWSSCLNKRRKCVCCAGEEGLKYY
jgi:hypothetical protein